MEKIDIEQNNDFPNVITARVSIKKVNYNLGNIYIDWVVEEDSSPQLSYIITIHLGDEQGPIIATNTDAVPEKRSSAFQVGNLTSGQYTASILLKDIFDNPSNFSFIPFMI